MQIALIHKTSRNICFEIMDGGRYNTVSNYDVYANGKLMITTDKVISSIYGLNPDTTYNLEIKKAGEGEVLGNLEIKTDYEFVTLNVKDFGALGDGEHDDTVAIQTAIMACPKDSRIYVPAGVYKISSLFLKSDITLDLAKDARLSAFTDRSKFGILPGMIQSYDEEDEYNVGTWEGNPIDCFSGIITAINAENIVITGEGTIDGCADFDTWWKNPKVRVGAWRPRLVFISHCKNVVLHGVTVTNSPSWTLHPYFTENISFLDMKVINPANSHNTDGMDPESCTGVKVIGLYFSVGDDCIAIKSGKFYMGKKLKKATSDMIIRQTCMRDGHGAVTVGSEIAAGVNNVKISECLFINTDRGLRVKTRRGRGKDSVLDNITFENITMDNVMTPFVVNSFYFCDPDGKTEYVASKKPLKIDERTPRIDRLTFRNIECHNCHVAASYIYGLPEQKIEKVVMENITVDFAENPVPGVAAMMLGCDESVRRGIVASNIKNLELSNVRVSGCEGDELVLSGVDNITTR